MRYLENRMQHPLQIDLLFGLCQKLQQSLNFLRKRVAARTAMVWMLGFGAIGSVTVLAQDKFVFDREGRTIVLEPYAPNILRITFSKDNATATGAPGYGVVGTPSMTGWAHEKDTEGNDVFRSSRLVIQVSADHLLHSRLSQPMPLVPNDPNVADIRDEYLFGPAFLVAPVTEQGATQRSVYLPAGCEWYNYWTNKRIKGGQTLMVNAPIDTIPLFVRAGSIVPLGSSVESAQRKQEIASVRVYPGADASFTLFSDDRNTYSYEKELALSPTFPGTRPATS
jgi:hypothetical protein